MLSMQSSLPMSLGDTAFEIFIVITGFITLAMYRLSQFHRPPREPRDATCRAWRTCNRAVNKDRTNRKARLAIFAQCVQPYRSLVPRHLCTVRWATQKSSASPSLHADTASASILLDHHLCTIRWATQKSSASPSLQYPSRSSVFLVHCFNER